MERYYIRNVNNQTKMLNPKLGTAQNEENSA